MEASSVVVVGVDGSPSSFSAAEQAAEEADLHGLGLRIVSAVSLPPLQAGPGSKAYETVVDAVHEKAESYLSEAESRARAVAPGIEVGSAVLAGDPLRVLAGLSRSASLVAVGSRGLGGLGGLLLGSVAVHLAAHADCPVMVVRGTPNPSGPVVVGVDGSPASRSAVEFAFTEASLAGVDLVAAHIWSEWSVPPRPPEDESLAYARKPGALRDEEEALLAEALSGLGEKYPDVRVERRALRGRTREELISASRNARLLVVGARGRGGFSGLLLGSVSQAVLHHAQCPVVVARRENPTL